MQTTIVPMSLGDIFDRLFKLIGKTALRNLMIAIIILIPIIFIGIGAGAESIGITLFGVMLCLVATVFATYLWVRWAFAVPAIAWEDTGVIQSFGRSSFLVKDYWWRTFGIILLLNILVQFAISIVTTPIQFIALWGFFSKYFTMISSISEGTADSIKLLELFNSIGTGVAIVIFVSYVLMLLIIPLITVVMYFDLRARKNEFDQSPELIQAV